MQSRPIARVSSCWRASRICARLKPMCSARRVDYARNVEIALAQARQMSSWPRLTVSPPSWVTLALADAGVVVDVVDRIAGR